MDGVLNDTWGQYLAELLGRDKVFTLSNGELLKMNDSSFKLIFETESLEQASPAMLMDSVSIISLRTHHYSTIAV